MKVLAHLDGTDEILNLSVVIGNSLPELRQALIDHYEFEDPTWVDDVLVYDVSGRAEQWAESVERYHDADKVIIGDDEFVRFEDFCDDLSRKS